MLLSGESKVEGDRDLDYSGHHNMQRNQKLIIVLLFEYSLFYAFYNRSRKMIWFLQEKKKRVYLSILAFAKIVETA